MILHSNIVKLIKTVLLDNLTEKVYVANVTMSQVVTTTVLRDNLSSVLAEVAEERDYLLVTKKGDPISALVNLDFFEDLLAATSPKYLESVRKAREQYVRGEVYTHEQVFGEL